MPYTAEIEAWHFCADTLRDGRPIPPDGEWLVHEGDVIACRAGLHASVRLIDALEYAPGSTLCRVIVRGDIQQHNNDKIVGRERQIVWRIDATAVLREFARKCALDVIHLWEAPDVVRKYLETGDESLRAAAWDAARDAARDAAWDAAWAAARTAAWDAAWDAARTAARAAAWDAAWDPAWDAARDAARTAARTAAWDAAWDVARTAARTAARAAARAAQNTAMERAAFIAAGRSL